MAQGVVKAPKVQTVNNTIQVQILMMCPRGKIEYKRSSSVILGF